MRNENRYGRRRRRRHGLGCGGLVFLIILMIAAGVLLRDSKYVQPIWNKVEKSGVVEYVQEFLDESGVLDFLQNIGFGDSIWKNADKDLQKDLSEEEISGEDTEENPEVNSKDRESKKNDGDKGFSDLMKNFPGRGLFEKVMYRLKGDDLQTWEQAAVDEGIAASAEEYYYAHLPEHLREAYREIYVKLMRYEDEANMMASVSVDEFWKVYYAVLADHPEIFWIGTSAQVEHSGLTDTVIAYDVDVTIPAEEREAVREKLETEADLCIGQIPAEYSDYQKIKAVYEYIVDRTEYQADSPDSQNIQSVLLNRASVCAGYSKTFQYILNRMGFFCTYITGTIKDGGEHGWNLVRIDDAYYYVDVTWGDPVFVNQVEGESGENSINYTYLCCTDETLFQTHIPGDSVPLPECSSETYDYYKIHGFYYETFDYWTMYEVLMDSVRRGDRLIEMKFGSREAYDNAVFELFEGNLLQDAGQYLMNQNGVNSWNYRYQTDEEVYTVILYWY